MEYGRKTIQISGNGSNLQRRELIGESAYANSISRRRTSLHARPGSHQNALDDKLPTRTPQYRRRQRTHHHHDDRLARTTSMTHSTSRKVAGTGANHGLIPSFIPCLFAWTFQHHTMKCNTKGALIIIFLLQWLPYANFSIHSFFLQQAPLWTQQQRETVASLRCHWGAVGSNLRHLWRPGSAGPAG